MERTPGDDATKMVGTTMKGLDYARNRVDKAAVGLEWTDPNSGSSTTAPMLSNSIPR